MKLKYVVVDRSGHRKFTGTLEECKVYVNRVQGKMLRIILNGPPPQWP